MTPILRTSRLSVLLGLAVLTASTSTVNAAFSVDIVADNSTKETTILSPTLQTTINNAGPLFTGGAGTTNQPAIDINPSTGVVTLNFNACLSPAFSSTAMGIINQQITDGHMVLNIHFDTPVSLIASIHESGLYTTTGNGFVNVVGGEVVIEAIHPLATESHAATLDPLFDNGFWSASATTSAFAGAFTDYQIIIDNSLIASATDGSAWIAKKTFALQLIPGFETRTSVPEPATLSLLALAAPALLLRRRQT